MNIFLLHFYWIYCFLFPSTLKIEISPLLFLRKDPLLPLSGKNPLDAHAQDCNRQPGGQFSQGENRTLAVIRKHYSYTVTLQLFVNITVTPRAPS